MLYFKALIDGLDAMPSADAAIRAEIEAQAAARGWPSLHDELARVEVAVKPLRAADAALTAVQLLRPLATVAACSFVGTSVFALSGLLLGDLAVGVPGLLQVVGASVLWDLLLTPLVLPVVLRLLADPDPEAVAA